MPPEGQSFQIRPVNTQDQAEMRLYQHLYVEAERAELPDAVVFSAEVTLSVLTRRSIGWFYHGYAAFENGRMVGEGLLSGSIIDNHQTAEIVAWVAPADRGRGVGSAMVEFLVGQSLARGRGILQTTAKYPAARRDDHPYRRFAERRGFTLANTEVERRLALPVASSTLATLERRSRRHHQGYRLLTVVGPLPADLAAGYVAVQNRLRVDAPSGDLVVEEGRRTPAVLADQERELHEQGRTRLTSLALDGSGRVVAFSCAVATVGSYPQVEQWGTIVLPEHRGHRLGMAVKVALVSAVQDAFPDKVFITTTNAETNHHMVSINETLGFRSYALSAQFQRILPGYKPVGEQVPVGAEDRISG